MTKVIVEPDESFESALKRFKKQCEKAGLLSEFIVRCSGLIAALSLPILPSVLPLR